MGDPIKNINFLKNLGFNQWLLCDEKYENFLSWIGNNVTNDNILTELELREYEDIIKDGKLLNNDELNSELYDLNHNYKNIFSFTEKDIALLERKLEDLTVIEELYENLTTQLAPVNGNILKDLTGMELSKKLKKEEEQRIAQDCIDTAKTLQAIELMNQKSLIEIQQCYMKTQNVPIFMYQMPLDLCFQKCEKFLKYVEVYLQNQFQLKSNSDMDIEIKHVQVKNELDGIKERLYQIEIDVFNEKMRTYSQRKLIQKLNSNLYQTQTLNEIENKVADLKISNGISQNIKENIMYNYEELLKRYTEQEIEFMLYENNKNKLQRAKVRLDHVQEISRLISKDLMNAEIIWILMQIDLEKGKQRNRYDNSDQKNKETQLCLKRIQLMESVLELSLDMNVYNNFFEKLNIICADVSNNILENLQLCFIEYNTFNKSTDNIIELMLNQSNYEALKNIIEENTANEKILEKYLKDGPVNKPNYWNLKFYEEMFNMNKEREVIDAQFSKFKNDYINFKHRDNTDELWRQKQILWIWFLTEPKKVIRCIESIADKAKTITMKSNNKVKSIAGIKRKQ